MDSAVTYTRSRYSFSSHKSVASNVYVYDAASNDTICLHLHDELYKKDYSHKSTTAVPSRKGYFGYWVY